MKKLILLITYLSVANSLMAQLPCKNYRSILKTAEKAHAEKNYKIAILKYSEAKVCAPRQTVQLDQKIVNIINTIDYQKIEAEKKAEQATSQAKQATNRAEQATNRAEQAEQMTKLTKRNEQAAQQTAQSQSNNVVALELKQTSPHLAHAIAYYNYQQYPLHTSVASVFHKLNSNISFFQHNEFDFFPDSTQAFVYLPSSALVMADGFERATLYDTTGRVLQQFRGHSDKITALAYSQKQSTILSASKDKTAKLWNTKSDLQQTFEGHQAALTSVDISPNGQKILTGSEDGTAKLWNLEGKMLQTFKTQHDEVTAVAFSPNSLHILTADRFGKIILWDTSANFIRLLKKHNKVVTSIHVSADGQHILTTSQDSTAILQNIEGKLLQHLKGHQGAVTAATFSKDGQYIITASTDQNLKTWNWQGQNIQTLKGHNAAIIDVQCAVDGRTIWSTSATGQVKSWWTIPAFFQQKVAKFSLHELALGGAQLTDSDLKLIKNEDALSKLIDLFYQREDWSMVTKIYAQLSKKQQKNAAVVLKYYDAQKQLGFEDVKSLAVFDKVEYSLVFAPYFAAQKNTNVALSFYDKIIKLDKKKNSISPQMLLDWYVLSPEKRSAFKTLLTYESTNYIQVFSLYFHQQKDWEKTRLFCKKILENEANLSPEQRWIWYESEKELGGLHPFDSLLAAKQLGHQRFFAHRFAQQQDWISALPFYEKMATQSPNATHFLELYEIEQHLENDIYETFLDETYAAYWLTFAQYFKQKKAWKKAQQLYQQLIAKEDTPELRYQLYQVNQELGVLSFRDLFLPNDVELLKRNYRYFNEKAKKQFIGHQKEAYEKAIRVSEHLLLLQDSRSNRQRLATFYNLLAWDRLYAEDFLASLTYIKREQDTKAKISLHRRIMPATLLFLNDTERARKLYRRWKHRKLPPASAYPRLKDAYLADLEEFEQRGIIHPKIADAVKEMKELLKRCGE